MKVWLVEYSNSPDGYKPWQFFLTESLANMAAADLRAMSHGEFRARVVEYSARERLDNTERQEELFMQSAGLSVEE